MSSFLTWSVLWGEKYGIFNPDSYNECAKYLQNLFIYLCVCIHLVHCLFSSYRITEA